MWWKDIDKWKWILGFKRKMWIVWKENRRIGRLKCILAVIRI
jgi:hypothetical protein